MHIFMTSAHKSSPADRVSSFWSSLVSFIKRPDEREKKALLEKLLFTVRGVKWHQTSPSCLCESSAVRLMGRVLQRLANSPAPEGLLRIMYKGNCFFFFFFSVIYMIKLNMSLQHFHWKTAALHFQFLCANAVFVSFLSLSASNNVVFWCWSFKAGSVFWDAVNKREYLGMHWYLIIEDYMQIVWWFCFLNTCFTVVSTINSITLWGNVWCSCTVQFNWWLFL